MRVRVMDYGVGNLHSLCQAIAVSGAEPTIVRSALEGGTEPLVLPGVGAFAPAAAHLHDQRDCIRHAVSEGAPLLGICLGMQLLFERSDEGVGEGLGLLRGSATRVVADVVPHMGWNELEDRSDPLLDASALTTAYFANSYACRVDELTWVRAWVSHGFDRFPAMVRSGAVVGVQFHPEKSSREGVAFLRSYFREVAA